MSCLAFSPHVLLCCFQQLTESLHPYSGLSPSSFRRWALPPASSGRISITLAGDALHPMTPNLGQGGCTALEDALVLGRSLQQAGAPALVAALQDSLAGGSLGGSGQQQQQQQQQAAAAVREGIGRYERERSQRCLPLTVRSHLMGAALQVRRLLLWTSGLPATFSRSQVPHGQFQLRRPPSHTTLPNTSRHAPHFVLPTVPPTVGPAAAGVCQGPVCAASLLPCTLPGPCGI